MKRRLTILLSITLLSGAAWARSSVGDWQSVQDIPAGWPIIVVTEFTFPCSFAEASDQELTCKPLQHAPDRDARDIHVRRDRIREIRVERRDGANMLAGAGAGGALGSLLGAIVFAGARGPSAYAFGLGGASVGGHAGRDLHVLPGKVIYRRPKAETNPGPSPTPRPASEPSARTSP